MLATIALLSEVDKLLVFQQFSTGELSSCASRGKTHGGRFLSAEPTSLDSAHRISTRAILTIGG